MTRFLPALFILALAACQAATPTQQTAITVAGAVVPALIPAPSGGVVKVLQTPAGQLFCKDASGAVFALADAGASAATGVAASVAVIATNATEKYVTDACAAASAAPVKPPEANAVVAVKAVAVPT